MNETDPPGKRLCVLKRRCSCWPKGGPRETQGRPARPRPCVVVSVCSCVLYRVLVGWTEHGPWSQADLNVSLSCTPGYGFKDL